LGLSIRNQETNGPDGVISMTFESPEEPKALVNIKENALFGRRKYHMDEQPNSVDETREAIGDFWISPLEYKIVQITGSDRVPVQGLSEVIAGEPLLAARLLRLANLIPGLPQVLTTVRQSIGILGLDQLKALTLGLSSLLLSQIPLSGRNAEREEALGALREIWEHSVGCATLAGRVAMKAGFASPQFAFVAGFLHDIGRLLLYRYSRAHYCESTAVAKEKNIPLTEAETLACGHNHLELGEIWSGRMELPLSLTTVIRYHHASPCMLPDFITEEVRNVVTLVRLTDLACESYGIGSGGDQPDGMGELWKACGLRLEDMTDDLRLVKQEVEGSREFFGFPNGNRTEILRFPHPAVTVGTALRPEPEKLAANDTRGRVIRFPVRKENSPKTGENLPSKRLTILVVEDHGSLCEMLSLYLIRYGYHVRTADNGQVALDVLSKENIDLVLLDLMLPRVDGFAVLKRVRETHELSKPYIIVVSAGASEKDRNRVLELGANEYMPKPFHLIRLLERIRAVEQYLLS
jgi:CheY-like chemotaxis protein/HD-like signal output (HDOD) protein